MTRARRLTVDAAVEVLTNRKTEPRPERVTAVLDRLADPGDRQDVIDRVNRYWAPLPARAKAMSRPVEVVAWGPGVQLELLPAGVEVGF